MAIRLAKLRDATALGRTLWPMDLLVSARTRWCRRWRVSETTRTGKCAGRPTSSWANTDGPGASTCSEGRRSSSRFGEGVARRVLLRQNVAVVPGERMLLHCQGGGPCVYRLVDYPPPLEIDERGGVYVLVDDGPELTWSYEWVPTAL